MSRSELSLAMPKFSSLLSAVECAVIFVDMQASVPCEESEKSWQSGFISLVERAATFDVPLMFFKRQKGTQFIEKLSSHSLCVVESQKVNPLDEPELYDKLSNLRRPRLLIGGGRADTSLSFAALGGLELGYDIYLLRDLIWGASDLLCETAVIRLLQAGVVPVSLPQVICEWQLRDC